MEFLTFRYHRASEHEHSDRPGQVGLRGRAVGERDGHASRDRTSQRSRSLTGLLSSVQRSACPWSLGPIAMGGRLSWQLGERERAGRGSGGTALSSSRAHLRSTLRPTRPPSAILSFPQCRGEDRRARAMWIRTPAHGRWPPLSEAPGPRRCPVYLGSWVLGWGNKRQGWLWTRDSWGSRLRNKCKPLWATSTLTMFSGVCVTQEASTLSWASTEASEDGRELGDPGQPGASLAAALQLPRHCGGEHLCCKPGSESTGPASPCGLEWLRNVGPSFPRGHCLPQSRLPLL